MGEWWCGISVFMADNALQSKRWVMIANMAHKLVHMISALDVGVFLFVNPGASPEEVIPCAPLVTTHRTGEAHIACDSVRGPYSTLAD